jgi:hypothetical protein
MREEILADRVQVSIGCLGEPHRVQIDVHVWTQDRVPRFDEKDDLPRFPGEGRARVCEPDESSARLVEPPAPPFATFA